MGGGKVHLMFSYFVLFYGILYTYILFKFFFEQTIMLSKKNTFIHITFFYIVDFRIYRTG